MWKYNKPYQFIYSFFILLFKTLNSITFFAIFFLHHRIEFQTNIIWTCLITFYTSLKVIILNLKPQMMWGLRSIVMWRPFISTHSFNFPSAACLCRVRSEWKISFKSKFHFIYDSRDILSIYYLVLQMKNVEKLLLYCIKIKLQI